MKSQIRRLNTPTKGVVEIFDNKISEETQLYLKNNNQINLIEEDKILEILKNIKFSNHMSVFSYLLSSYGYR